MSCVTYVLTKVPSVLVDLMSHIETFDRNEISGTASRSVSVSIMTGKGMAGARAINPSLEAARARKETTRVSVHENSRFIQRHG